MSAAAVLSLFTTIILDGGVALAIMLVATALGALVIRWLGLRHERPSWVILLGCGVGSGLLALWVLCFGVLGFIGRGSRVVAFLALSLLATGWLVRQIRQVRTASGSATGTNYATGASTESRTSWLLWIVAVPFLVLSLCTATCPPGYLWPSEGNGYDVLEYHFGAPKEWFVAGRIEYLPHNIYSNFPLNAEMLYLLSFVVAGSPVAGVYVAQFVNLLLAVLAVAGAWLAGREFGRLPGVVAGVAVATCPFVTWLCGMAYVENGMLAMAMLSLACVVRAARRPGESVVRWAFVGGLLAGFACGFKYTAIPTVALPVLVSWMIAGRSRMQVGLAFSLGAAAAFSPWMIRNTVNTGNPVFPLARSVFHERAGVWSDEAAARWSEGHRPDPTLRSPLMRVREIGPAIIANPMFGVPLFVFGAWGAIVGLRRWRRASLAAIAFVCVVLAVWACTTHLIDRFALAIIAPLAVLAAIAAATPSRGAKMAVVAMVTGGAAWNACTTIAFFRKSHVFQVAAFGQTEWMTSGQWPSCAHLPALNQIQESGGKVLMLGDARAFYVAGRPGYHVVFNRNPFAEAVAAWLGDPNSATRPDRWLREHGYTHLYVDWGEISRLSRSRYGFWPGLADLHKSNYEQMGLTPEASFESNGRAYATLFRIGERYSGPTD